MSDYVPDEYTAKQMYVLQRQSMHNHISPDYGAEFDRFIAKVKADERRSLLEELTTDAEQEASIGRQGNDRERVNAAEKIIEMLNDIRIEGEA